MAKQKMKKKGMLKKGMHKMPGGMMMSDAEMEGMMQANKVRTGMPKKKTKKRGAKRGR